MDEKPELANDERYSYDYLNSYIKRFADVLINSPSYAATMSTAAPSSLGYSVSESPIVEEKHVNARAMKGAIEQYKSLKDLAYIIDSDPDKSNTESLNIAINLTLLNSINELKELIHSIRVKLSHSNRKREQIDYENNLYGRVNPNSNITWTTGTTGGSAITAKDLQEKPKIEKPNVQF